MSLPSTRPVTRLLFLLKAATARNRIGGFGVGGERCLRLSICFSEPPPSAAMPSEGQRAAKRTSYSSPRWRQLICWIGRHATVRSMPAIDMRLKNSSSVTSRWHTGNGDRLERVVARGASEGRSLHHPTGSMSIAAAYLPLLRQPRPPECTRAGGAILQSMPRCNWESSHPAPKKSKKGQQPKNGG